jgi:16S rRNA (cytosine1407-C5)-methyltransferase
MEKIIVQNRKEVERISNLLKTQFGCDFSFISYALYQNNRDKLYIVDKSVVTVDFNKIRVNALGLYFGEINEGMIRLSMEGAQMIGPLAKKNVVEISNDEAKEWMQGIDIEIKTGLSGYVLIKNNNDFLGCGKATQNKILNYVPKIRRLN